MKVNINLVVVIGTSNTLNQTDQDRESPSSLAGCEYVQINDFNLLKESRVTRLQPQRSHRGK